MSQVRWQFVIVWAYNTNNLFPYEHSMLKKFSRLSLERLPFLPHEPTGLKKLILKNKLKNILAMKKLKIHEINLHWSFKDIKANKIQFFIYLKIQKKIIVSVLGSTLTRIFAEKMVNFRPKP